MATSTMIEEREYGSGEIVEPGYYVDIENGAVIQVNTTDELPEGRRVVEYRRRFRRVPAEAVRSGQVRAGRSR